MSKKIFSIDQINALSENKYVKSVSSRGITYTEEFKKIFISEHNKGKLPVQIFQNAGFDVEVLGNYRIWSASKRWRTAYKEHGNIGLKDSRHDKNNCYIKIKYEDLE